jgi:hypothetical protein
MSRSRSSDSPRLQRRLSRLEGRMPSGALDELSDRELWALQRDLIDAAFDTAPAPQEVAVRVRGWARSFQVGGADDLPAKVLWERVRPLVDHQAGGMELDWLSPRMQAILAETA